VDAARYGVVAGIGLLAGGLVVKRLAAPAAGPCDRPIDCRACPALADCTLPAASRARRGGRG